MQRTQTTTPYGVGQHGQQRGEAKADGVGRNAIPKMFGLDDAAVVAVVRLVSGAMKLGAAFISNKGKKNADNVICKIEVAGGRKIKGHYSGQMAVLKKGYFKSSWGPCGDGKIVLANGDHYTGRWLDGQFNSSGVYESQDGTYRYDGYHKAGKPNGYGKEFGQDSRGKLILRYEGSFADGRYHGKGTYYKDDGRSSVGKWANGQLREAAQSSAERNALSLIAGLNLTGITATTGGPGGARVVPVTASEVRDCAAARGLGRNVIMASLITQREGVTGNVTLKGLRKAPSISVQSHDAKGECPVVSMEAKQVDLDDLRLPKIMSDALKVETGLDWLKTMAAKYEKLAPGTKSKVKSLESLSVKRVIVAAGIVIDPSKESRGEFSPVLTRRVSESGKGEIWGQLSWLNTGTQYAEDCEYAGGGKGLQIMRNEGTKATPVRRGWGLQSIDLSKTDATQAAGIREQVINTMANTMHVILFRYKEPDQATSAHPNQKSMGSALDIGVMVEGRHREADTRGTYTSSKYREIDLNSIVCVDIAGVPVNVRSDRALLEGEIQESVTQHVEEMRNVMENISRVIG
jgi:hypothetical protein